MNSATDRLARRRSGWFADRPIAVKILAMIALSACVGVLLCAVAASRIGTLAESQSDLYPGHVLAFSDLDAIQATYEELGQGYTSYFLADPAGRQQLKPQLERGRVVLGTQLDAYEGFTEHPDRFAARRADVRTYFEVADRSWRRWTPGTSAQRAPPPGRWSRCRTP
jgi:methyl-accepting chemotaxis protein